MPDIAVPKYNNNDDGYILVEWLFDDGARIPPGEVVALVETSKATHDLECDEGGILHRVASVDDQCGPGDVIGHLFPSEADLQRFRAGQTADPEAAENAPLIVTEAARTLMAQHGITEDRLRALDKAVIKGADVRSLLDAAGGPTRQPLSRLQKAVADVVTASHRDIPAAFTVVKVEVGEAIELARRVAERCGDPVGLPELVVKGVAGLRAEFPAFFATLSGTDLILTDTGGVGVTVDTGKGLYIPVIPGAAELTLDAIADMMLDFRIKALRGDFHDQDLTGASIVVSLNNDDGVLLAQSIIFPGHTCILSLGATMDEPAVAEDGSVYRRRCAHLGLTFDHRAINGRQAVVFLQRLKGVLESPGHLSEAGGAQ
ncbi:2-oxo acid dehydrogenase subunit E2 [Streptosporangium soli]|nr:2-oxo acid dehydrogenase subunit E2 [Streptosporangium sp. KLBMP 9127]